MCRVRELGDGEGILGGEMTIEEAVALLKTHNTWRRGADIPMTDARNLGTAIDTVVAYHENGRDDLK